MPDLWGGVAAWETFWDRLVTWVIGDGLRVLLTLVLALVVRWLAHRAINRVVGLMTSKSVEKVGSSGRAGRVLAQAAFETRTILRNGEQLLVTIALPVFLLVGLVRAGPISAGRVLVQSARGSSPRPAAIIVCLARRRRSAKSACSVSSKSETSSSSSARIAGSTVSTFAVPASVRYRWMWRP